MDESINLVQLWQITSMAKRRASDLDVSIEFDGLCDVPNYRPNHITFPLPSLPMTDKDFILMKHAYIHEPLHHTRKLTNEICKAYTNLPKELMLMWNAIEDDSMERTHALTYRGDAEDMSKGFERAIQGSITSFKEFMDGAKEAGELASLPIKMAAVMGIMVNSRTDWDKRASSAVYDLEKFMPKESKDLYDLLKASGWVELFRAATTELSVHKRARQLTQLLFPDVEVPDAPACADLDEETKPEEKQDDEEEQETTSKEKGIEEEQQKESKVEEKVKDIDENTTTLTNEEIKEIDWEELTNINDTGIEQLGAQAQHINWKGKDTGDGTWTPCPDKNRKYYNLKEELKGIKKITTPKKYYKERAQDKILANQIRRYIQTLTRTKLHTERLSGSIHNANLYRVAVPQVGDGSWNRRIFKQKQNGLDIDTCVQVLVDWSGSMWGLKMLLAAQASQCMLNVFDKVLHIPIELLMFGVGSHYSFGVAKDFNEKTYTIKDIVDRMHLFYNWSGGNQDADALLWAAGRLEKRKEKRKILIVLSDGCPTDAWDGSADYGLRKAVKDIKKRNKIEMYGIGIMDNNVKRYYGKNAQVIHDVNNLNKALLTTIKEGVIHGGH